MVYDYKNTIVSEPTALTIGNFDGVHLGHRNLIKRLKETAAEKRLMSVILTFAPHPRTVLDAGGFLRITNDHEKELILNELSVDKTVFLSFDSALSALLPKDYVAEVLIKALNCKHVVVGENHSFGKNKSGDAATLKRLCEEFGITADIAPSIYLEGERVSSARVRNCLALGDICEANRLLSDSYFVLGKIISGNSIGRTLGFPTINLEYGENKLLPKDGVYFTQTQINGSLYSGITNVGIRPTVSGLGRTIETFLFDFNRKVYGETAKLSFLHRRRDEAKFKSLTELKSAIAADKEAAASYFASFNKYGELK